MPVTASDRLMQRLQREGTRKTWAINSTVYLLDGERYIVWSTPKHDGPAFIVAPLGPEYTDDHYGAAVLFLTDQRLAGWPTRSPMDLED